MALLSTLKSLVLPRGACPRRILLGIYRGLVMDLDFSESTQLYLGLWERENQPWIRLAATRCEWAIDVGAGAGELSLYLLRHSSARRIFAFEPDGAARDRFLRNIVLNGLDAGEVLMVLGNSAGTAGDAPNQTSLDALDVERHARGFVRIDVEGAEMDVLRSGERLFGEGRIDLLLETHSLDLERDCLAFLDRKGFTCHIIERAWWRAVIPEHRSLPHNRWVWATRA